MSGDGPGGIFNTKDVRKTRNFELADCWDEGEPSVFYQGWSVCTTMNLVCADISIE